MKLELIRTTYHRHARFQIYRDTDSKEPRFLVIKHLKLWKVFDTLVKAEAAIRKS